MLLRPFTDDELNIVLIITEVATLVSESILCSLKPDLHVEMRGTVNMNMPHPDRWFNGTRMITNA